jgi:hypothetical protein
MPYSIFIFHVAQYSIFRFFHNPNLFYITLLLPTPKFNSHQPLNHLFSSYLSALTPSNIQIPITDSYSPNFRSQKVAWKFRNTSRLRNYWPSRKVDDCGLPRFMGIQIGFAWTAATKFLRRVRPPEKVKWNTCGPFVTS